MSPERVSNTQKVRIALRECTPYSELGEKTGLGDKAYRALKYLRREGEIPRPTKEEHYQHLSSSISGRKRPEISANQTSSWIPIFPLALREGTPAEIAELVTGYTPRQISKLISIRRGAMKLPDEYWSAEKKHARRVRVYQREGRINRGEQLSNHEKNAVRFAKSLHSEGFFKDDLKFQQLGERIYGKDWPEYLAEQLILEGYINARVHEIKGKPELMKAYVQIGRSVDPIWFNSAELNAKRKIIRTLLDLSIRTLS